MQLFFFCLTVITYLPDFSFFDASFPASWFHSNSATTLHIGKLIDNIRLVDAVYLCLNSFFFLCGIKLVYKFKRARDVFPLLLVNKSRTNWKAAVTLSCLSFYQFYSSYPSYPATNFLPLFTMRTSP